MFIWLGWIDACIEFSDRYRWVVSGGRGGGGEGTSIVPKKDCRYLYLYREGVLTHLKKFFRRRGQ